MARSSSTRPQEPFLTVRFSPEPDSGCWVVDWAKMKTTEDALDLLWALARTTTWKGEMPPSGIEHLVKRVEA